MEFGRLGLADTRAELSPIFGRDGDLASVLAALERSRLVSLTGPGGSGKTRLAQAVISALRDADNTAWFVDASRLEESELLTPTVVAAIAPGSGAHPDPLDAMAEAIGDGTGYMALDNLEQIPNVGAVVESMLGRIAGLRILATSRVRLRVTGETEYPVPPLALPAGKTLSALEESPAGALFLARARSAGFPAELDAATTHAVTLLLRRLDGLPLAIELAAARTRLIQPSEILYWLDERGLAAVDAATTDAHRSLRAITDWTTGLLTIEQAKVLDAVSVCAGFDLRLAQALTPEEDVLEPMDALIGLGLVRRAGEADDVSRFALLETIRTEVGRRLSNEDRSTYRARHAEAMMVEAAALRTRMHGPDQPRALSRLDADADNFRAALDWLDATDPLRGLELWALLDVLWTSSHRHREGMARFKLTEALVPEPTIQLSRAMSRYVGLSFDLHGSVQSKALNQRALALALEVGDSASEVEALGGVVMAAVVEDDLETARSTADEVAAIAERIDDPEARWNAAQARCFAVMAIHGAASDEMLHAYQVAVDAAIESGRVEFEMNSRGNLAVVQVYRAEFEAAAHNAHRAVQLARQVHSHLLNWCLGTQAIALAETGHVEAAIAALIEGASDVAVLAVPERMADVLTAGTAVALAAGDPLLSASWRGTIDQLYAADPSIAQPENIVMLDRTMSRVRRRAREIEMEIARDEGRKADALEVLAALPEKLAGRSRAPDAAARLRHGELTRREIEVLRMVGNGKSDGEIGEALFISPKTASVHVSNVRAKLGAASRLDLALQARKLGLSSDEK